MSRPRKLGDGSRLVSAFITASMHAIARDLGAGNVSEGIRVALLAERARRDVLKAQSAFEGLAGDELLNALGARKASSIKRG